MNGTLVAILATVAVAVLALLMRRGSSVEPVAPGGSSPDAGEALVSTAEDPDDADGEADAGDDPIHVPVTSEGVALIPTGHHIRLLALVQSEEIPDWLKEGIESNVVPYSLINQIYGFSAHPDRGPASGTVLSAGDFTGARLQRDAAGHWRLETLGRDGDFGFMPFATEARAHDALELLEHAGIIGRPLDEDGEPVPPSAEDFEEARRRYEETERDLALGGDEDEPPPPAEWSSRR